MNKNYFIALLGATLIATSAAQASETESFGTKAAKAVKTAISFVKDTTKGTANLPNSIAHHFGYCTNMSTSKQFVIAGLFWVAVGYAIKKAYETYKKELSKRAIQENLDEIMRLAEEDNSYKIEK